jgi:hypothetical protein
MADIIVKNENAISLGSVEEEKDLKPIPGVANINPPPQDGKCMCCKRHISELKPYGKAGDPLVGDFDGALLVKVWRSEGPYTLCLWLCRDCVVLGRDEYFKKMEKMS